MDIRRGQPKVFFMHIGGEGKVADLGKTVKAAMDEVAAIRKKTPKPATTFDAAKLPCGCPTGKAMGVNTWAAFAGTDDNAVVDGDFAVAESELQPVLEALRGGGINVVAIHHHMSGEHPRILFLHYWGRGKAEALAKVVKSALDLTAWSGKGKTT